MKNFIEKQKLEWQEELNKQLAIKKNAEKVVEETNKTILRIDGGLVAMNNLLKKIESEETLKHKEDLEPQSKTAPSN
tara:strand:+ start:114 stop:344 length:231 start_codon:yes stop_codon:yes gene_type:complete